MAETENDSVSGSSDLDPVLGYTGAPEPTTMESLTRSNERLERINNELLEFALVASHDLREPLRTISGFCRLLASNYHGKFDERADEWLTFIVDATERMQRMIDDLLTYSQLDSMDPSEALTDASAVTRTVLQDLDAAIQEAGATVTYDPLPMIPMHPTQLHQLLLNLISNALKYRREEALIVHISARQHASAWEFAVKDNGIGIEPEDLSQIFELFKRLQGHNKHTGTGIGLAVCEKIVRRHGGRIWVDSTPGVGSTFYFTIPIHV